MDVKTLKNGDMIEVIHDEVHIRMGKEAHCFQIADIAKLAILTTDQGPVVDDMALLVVAKETFFIVPSENAVYEKFLFDGIAPKIPIDFQKVIEASSCSENAEFVLYTK